VKVLCFFDLAKSKKCVLHRKVGVKVDIDE
jgi:hypothetical protein